MEVTHAEIDNPLSTKDLVEVTRRVVARVELIWLDALRPSMALFDLDGFATLRAITAKMRLRGPRRS
jgi:hypothetical protein